MASTARNQKIETLYEIRVRELVAAHAKLEDTPLVLAIRYNKGFKSALWDVHLLEIVEHFPGTPDEPPFPIEFEPNAQFQIMGKLYLTLASPDQLRHAISLHESGRRTAGAAAAKKLLDSVRRSGEVVFSAASPPGRKRLANALTKELGLR
jgi:hypothetical protein